ncbi:MAG: MFS transporter [Actinobacteria bacterium]|nr:MAG: MFS transporter [Actinomycetota bacterium]
MNSPIQTHGIRPSELLAIRPFRLLWINSFLFILVQSTQRFAFVWLALELGAKSDISGLILFVMGIPVLLISLPIGVMSDHMNRRTLLMVSQIGALVITTVVAVMVTTEIMTINWAIIGSFIAGIFIAIGSPVRSAIVPTVVPRDKLVGAIAVNTIGNNLGLMIGPATAGPAIAIWGIEGAFWIQALLNLFGFFALIKLQLMGLSQSDAICQAIQDAALRLREPKRLAAEMAKLEADPVDRAEMLAVINFKER